jgi:hypothetical protein
MENDMDIDLVHTTYTGSVYLYFVNLMATIKDENHKAIVKKAYRLLIEGQKTMSSGQTETGCQLVQQALKKIETLRDARTICGLCHALLSQGLATLGRFEESLQHVKIASDLLNETGDLPSEAAKCKENIAALEKALKPRKSALRCWLGF